MPVSVVHLTLGVPSHVRARVNQTYRALSEVTTDVADFAESDVVGRAGRRRRGDRRRGGDRRRRAGHPGRQQDPHAGAARPRVGRPHRADRRGRARPVPHRRRAAGGALAAGRHGTGAGEPHQDHGGHEHRRAAASPGRPARDEHRRHVTSTSGSPPRRRSGARRRSCGCSTAPGRCSGSSELGMSPALNTPLLADRAVAVRHGDRQRADRQRQDHHALRHADRDQPAGHERHDHRGPGRVRLPQGQPDPDQRAGRAHASPPG